MDVAIVKYNAGNIYSVVNAMKRLGISPILTDDAETLRKADRVLFPGQGQAREAMLYLKAHGLDETIKSLTQPVLGICVGQQLLCRHSEEGDVDCIGIFDVDVKKFVPQQHQDKVPAMGWNEIYNLSSHTALQCRSAQRQFLHLPVSSRKERKGRRTNPQELYGTMNIELIPAIDIIGGQCVRLTKGDYDQKKVYYDNPAEVAKHFEKLGFKRLHVVDLDGAKSKHIVNDNVLKAITSATSLTVDFGGGIKTEEDIEKAFDAGAAMVTVGSIAVTNPELFLSWIDKYGAGRLILGADVRNGKISINGWKEDSAEDLLPFLKQYTDKGVRNVLCTEISKDGTLQGPAIELYKEIMAAYPDLHLIASGGVSCNEDIDALETAGIPAVVFGKAFYEGKIDIDKLGL